MSAPQILKESSTLNLAVDITISRKLPKSIDDTKLLSEYQKVVDASSIVSKTDLKGIITYVNDEFCKICGYSREELIGKPHSIVRHPNMPSSAFKDLWDTVQAKKIWKGTVENLKKDGGSYVVKATIIPILDENENIVEYIGLRDDITDLIEKGKEIQRLTTSNLKSAVSQALTLKTFDILKHIPVPLVCIDEGDNILEHNDEFEKLFDIESSNSFLTNLAKHKANIKDAFEFGLGDECLLEWKGQLLSFEETKEVVFKNGTKDRFSLRIKENEEDTFIVAFV